MANKETYPFRDISDLRSVYKFLLKHDYEREAHLLIIGCNMALRISDLLQLRFDQIDMAHSQIKEKKTKKAKKLTFNNVVKEHVEQLADWYAEQNYKPVYLFESHKSHRNRERRPVTARWVNKKLQEAAEARDIEYPIGTHSMRKTWGYTAFNNGMKLENIQKTLNHSSPGMTLKYIGIMDEDIEQGYMENEIRV